MNNTSNITLSEVGELFLKFVRNVKGQICKINDDFKWEGLPVALDYDLEDPTNHERLSLDGWNAVASTWVAVESDTTYAATMTSIVERVLDRNLPKNRHTRILSLGSGPGLYEIFLAWCLKKSGVPSRIISTDYAAKMIAFQERILHSKILIDKTKVSALREICTPTIADMTSLSQVRDGTIDIVICNNSLQWVTDWKKAIMEMGRVLRPDGQKTALLFIHPHAMKMSIGDSVLKKSLVDVDSVLDSLHEAGLSPTKSRTILGAKGTSQTGGHVNRMMIEARYHPYGGAIHWRDLVRTAGPVQPFRTPG